MCKSFNNKSQIRYQCNGPGRGRSDSVFVSCFVLRSFSVCLINLQLVSRLVSTSNCWLCNCCPVWQVNICDTRRASEVATACCRRNGCHTCCTAAAAVALAASSWSSLPRCCCCCNERTTITNAPIEKFLSTLAHTPHRLASLAA